MNKKIESMFTCTGAMKSSIYVICLYHVQHGKIHCKKMCAIDVHVCMHLFVVTVYINSKCFIHC